MKYLAGLILLVMLSGCAAPALTPSPVLTPAAEEASPTVKAGPTATDTVPAASPTPAATVNPIAAEDEYAFSQMERLGRGVNLGNALEAPTEGEWGVVLQEEYFALIKEAGFDSVRVPIAWSQHAAKEAPYTIDAAFFVRVDWVVEQAKKNDLAAVLNIHHFNELMEDPRGQHDRFIALWEQIAEHYKSQPESILFELLNEPTSTLSNTSWNDFAVEAIGVIRRIDPKRTIVVGPGNWNSIGGLDGLVLPENERNLIVTFHFYDPFSFTHQGAEWSDPIPPVGIKWEGTEDEQKALLYPLVLARKWGERNRRPMYMGEFGAYSKGDIESRQRWTAYVARTAEANGFSWAYWEFCAGFGVYDPTAKQWNEPILSALIP